MWSILNLKNLPFLTHKNVRISNELEKKLHAACHFIGTHRNIHVWKDFERRLQREIELKK